MVLGSKGSYHEPPSSYWCGQLKKSNSPQRRISVVEFHVQLPFFKGSRFTMVHHYQPSLPKSSHADVGGGVKGPPKCIHLWRCSGVQRHSYSFGQKTSFSEGNLVVDLDLSWLSIPYLWKKVAIMPNSGNCGCLLAIYEAMFFRVGGMPCFRAKTAIPRFLVRFLKIRTREKKHVFNLAWGHIHHYLPYHTCILADMAPQLLLFAGQCLHPVFARMPILCSYKFIGSEDSFYVYTYGIDYLNT